MTVIKGFDPSWRKKSQARQSVITRPFNCNFETSFENRCPHCGYNHTRHGYCQALDPLNADRYPHLHGGAAVTDNSAAVTLIPEDVTLSPEDVTLSLNVTDNVTLSGDVTLSEADVSVTDDVSVTCAGCGEAFAAQRATAKFCSASCRQRARRAEAKSEI
jgi:hypothetical protein